MKKFDIREWKEKILLLEAESMASSEAKKKGLTSIGFGRWADKSGKMVAKTIGNKLVMVKKDQQTNTKQKKPVNIFGNQPKSQPKVQQKTVKQPTTTKSGKISKPSSVGGGVSTNPEKSQANDNAVNVLLSKFKPPKENPFKRKPRYVHYGSVVDESDVINTLKKYGSDAGGYAIRTSDGHEAFTETGEETAYALRIAKKRGIDSIVIVDEYD